jgi:hypothetical protein
LTRRYLLDRVAPADGDWEIWAARYASVYGALPGPSGDEGPGRTGTECDAARRALSAIHVYAPG